MQAAKQIEKIYFNLQINWQVTSAVLYYANDEWKHWLLNRWMAARNFSNLNVFIKLEVTPRQPYCFRVFSRLLPHYNFLGSAATN